MAIASFGPVQFTDSSGLEEVIQAAADTVNDKSQMQKVLNLLNGFNEDDIIDAAYAVNSQPVQNIIDAVVAVNTQPVQDVIDAVVAVNSQPVQDITDAVVAVNTDPAQDVKNAVVTYLTGSGGQKILDAVRAAYMQSPLDYFSRLPLEGPLDRFKSLQQTINDPNFRIDQALSSFSSRDTAALEDLVRKSLPETQEYEPRETQSLGELKMSLQQLLTEVNEQLSLQDDLEKFRQKSISNKILP